MSSNTAPSPRSKTPTTPGDSPDTADGIKLESALTVINNKNSKTSIISPIQAKALLTRFEVTHQQNRAYRVEGPANTNTVDRETSTCTCSSTRPDHGKNCEHLQHLEEREKHQLAPIFSSTENTSKDTAATAQHPDPKNTDNNETSGTALECDECGRDIGTIDHNHPKIQLRTCNVCALDNHDIYYLDEDPNDSPHLTLFQDIFPGKTINSYYHTDSIMSVHDFFETHPKTTATDSVVTVSRRLDAPDCSGLLFETDTIAVPESLLTKAINTL